MLEALFTVYFGLALWQWLLIAAAAILVVIGLVKKAVKLAITVAIIAVVYLALVQFGII
jgi:hypothetical protein